MRAPFPWFGGKSTVSDLVWSAFGDVRNYVEPFFGSGAVLLNRPDFEGSETVNDLDGYLANFWRAIQHDPESVAKWADWPVNENDLHARHAWLVAQKEGFVSRLEGDPAFYDAKVAGWWVWGICSWIGGGWCSGKGPWQVVDRQLVHLSTAGQGINRKRVHLGDAGQGINRKRVHLGDAGRGINRKRGESIAQMFQELSDRLRDVRVCCGDWTRVLGDSVTITHGITGVFLDPPYADTANRYADLYAEDSLDVAHDVQEWAITNGENKLLRIALCGYEGEHTMPGNWRSVPWKARGGYGSQGKTTGRENAVRERIWFSPWCISPQSEVGLFDGLEDAS